MSSRLIEDEREALRIAAAAARPVVAKLKLLRDELDQRIARFDSIIEAYEETAGKRAKKSSSQASPERPERGKVTERIDEILAGGGDYREPELRGAIWERFAIKYSRATTYTALRRGEGKRYEQKERRWRMKQIP